MQVSKISTKINSQVKDYEIFLLYDMHFVCYYFLVLKIQIHLSLHKISSHISVFSCTSIATSSPHC